jgi:ERCC4-type nuclease
MPTIELLIDNREHGLIEHIIDNRNVSTLDLGDINIMIDGKLKIMIERKTIDDLANSIRDGRYKEQKQRCIAFRKENPDIMLVYMIEGKHTFDPLIALPNYRFHKCNNAVIIGSIINSMFRDKYYVISTRDVCDSANFVKGLYDRLSKKPNEYFIDINDQVDDIKQKQEHTISLIKSKRKENIDVSTCFMLQLCDIPGISSKKAALIISKLQVGTMSAFIKVIEKEPLCLQSIPGIGPILVKNIKLFLGIQ